MQRWRLIIPYVRTSRNLLKNDYLRLPSVKPIMTNAKMTPHCHFVRRHDADREMQQSQGVEETAAGLLAPFPSDSSHQRHPPENPSALGAWLPFPVAASKHPSPRVTRTEEQCLGLLHGRPPEQRMRVTRIARVHSLATPSSATWASSPGPEYV